MPSSRGGALNQGASQAPQSTKIRGAGGKLGVDLERWCRWSPWSAPLVACFSGPSWSVVELSSLNVELTLLFGCRGLVLRMFSGRSIILFSASVKCISSTPSVHHLPAKHVGDELSKSLDRRWCDVEESDCRSTGRHVTDAGPGKKKSSCSARSAFSYPLPWWTFSLGGEPQPSDSGIASLKSCMSRTINARYCCTPTSQCGHTSSSRSLNRTQHCTARRKSELVQVFWSLSRLSFPEGLNLFR